MKALVVSILCLSVSIAAHGAREVDTKDFSGWMADYDSLVFNEKRNAFIFFNEDKRGMYSKVWLQSVEIYAKNADGETEIAQQASDYLRAGIEKIFQEQGVGAQEPGPGVLRFRLAITGVEKSKEDLKAYNFIPVSAVFRGAQAATGNVATYIDAMFEAELIDSVSGERVGAVVQKGISETEKRSGDELEFSDVVPTLDSWLERYDQTLRDFLARRQ